MPTINARTYIVDEDIAKVSLVGTGMKSSPGRCREGVRDAGPKRHQHSGYLHEPDSPVRGGRCRAGPAQAVQCLHTAFGLDSDSVFVETQLSAEEIAAKMNKGR